MGGEWWFHDFYLSNLTSFWWGNVSNWVFKFCVFERIYYRGVGPPRKSWRYLILAQPPLNIHRISCLNELAFDHNSIKKLMFSISSFNQIFYTHNKNICDQSGTFLWTIYIFWCSIDSKNVCFFCIYKNRKHMNFLAYFDFKDPLNVRNIFNI